MQLNRQTLNRKCNLFVFNVMYPLLGNMQLYLLALVLCCIGIELFFFLLSCTTFKFGIQVLSDKLLTIIFINIYFD